MSSRRLPRRGAPARVRAPRRLRPAAGALGRRAAVLATVALGAGLGGAAPAGAWTTFAPPTPVAHAAGSHPPRGGGLPAMGVPYAELLQVAPQLAPASATATGSSVRRGAVASSAPADAGSIVQMRPGASVEVHRSPAGPIIEQLDSRTDSGSQARAFTVYAVAGSEWLGVSVPALGGHLGWIAANPANVFVRVALQEIRVSLAQRSLELLDAGRVVLSTPVVIGGASTPTPPGQFSVDDILRFQPASPEYGIGALALSVPPPGRNWVYWRVAIHGENNLGQLGGTGSLGCVHVPAGDLRRLLDVPVGTPVDIVA